MDIIQKDRWVKDGHCTPYLKTSIYAVIVSRESIHIILTHAALHLTPVMAADICSAYLQATTYEKQYIFCGPEFGLENVGKRTKIMWDLYLGKSVGSDFWHHLCSCMSHLGF